MRNCYVFGCDRQHRDDPKRAMFNVPKDPEKFEEWRLALPKHRALRPHDRVCEKHFKPEDIQRDWTYTIKGVTQKLARAKPVLLSDAVPCIFDTVKTINKKESRGRRKKAESPSEDNKVLVVVERTNQEDDPVGVERTSMLVVIEHDSSDGMNKQSAPSVVGEGQLETEPDAATKESIFEELYDNIYEVELPSMLWGVHREPDRKFVAFSRFEWCQPEANVVKSVSLLIDCSLCCRAWAGGEMVLERNVSSRLAPKPEDKEGRVRLDALMNLLDKLEEIANEECLGEKDKIKKGLELCLNNESLNYKSEQKAATADTIGQAKDC